MSEKPAFFWMQSWAGMTKVPVEVVGETKSRYYKCKLLEDSRTPGRYKFRKKGEILNVPKDALHYEECKND